MTFTNDQLDRLAPALPWEPDWNDVLRRAGQRPAGDFRPRPVLTRRRMVVGLVVLAAVLIPLAALAAANDWWFLRSGNAPHPVRGPVVVKEGTWSGRAWQLIAYPSATDGLCLSVTPKDAKQSGFGAAMGCGPFAGVSRTAETKKSPDMTITYLAGAGGPLPPYIVGPVIEQATEVEIRLTNGQSLSVQTFAGSPPLEHIRFYATELTEAVAPTESGRGIPEVRPEWIAGRDEQGNIVACLVPLKAKDGISPLSDCR